MLLVEEDQGESKFVMVRLWRQYYNEKAKEGQWDFSFEEFRRNFPRIKSKYT